MALTITTAHLFDGHRWKGPASVRVRGDVIVEVTDPVADADILATTVVPGLVDYAVSASGYTERPDPEHPYAPEEAFATLCLRFGVTTIIDIANEWPALACLDAGAKSNGLPQILYGGARLCTTPRGRHDIVVTGSTCECVIRSQAALGASFLSLGKLDDADIVDRVVELAQELQLPLVWAAQDYEVPGLFWTLPEVTPVGEGPDWAAAIEDAAAYFAPQLEASNRWTVEGLLAAEQAHLASPVTPYARNFARMSGFVGRRIGRDVLERLCGHRQTSMLRSDIAQIVCGFADRGTCLAASGAVAAGVVPGLSLWHEIERLSSLLGEPMKALHSATAAGAGLWPGIGPGVIDAGRRADMLLFDTQLGDGSVGEFHQDLHTAIVGGRRHEVAQLDKEVRIMVEEACKEAV